jgi:hypothetical protein
MKTISVEEFRTDDRYLAATAQENIILTEGGKPRVVLQAIPEDMDVDPDALSHSVNFWEMINRRRQEQTPLGRKLSSNCSWMKARSRSISACRLAVPTSRELIRLRRNWGGWG